MISRAFVLDTAVPSAVVTAQIERALAIANARLGTTFAHDGAETQDGVLFTVWTDDVDGTTETSWVRLSEAPQADLRHLQLNATTEAMLETLAAIFADELGELTTA